MEIFKEDIVLNWGEIYLGLKKQWISPTDVLKICNDNDINNCNEDRLVKLYLSFDESLIAFYEEIKKFIIEDSETPIFKNEDESERDLNYIPNENWNIWKLEFLLRVVNSSKNTEQQLIEISNYFHEFNFPNDWKEFIYYQPNENVPPLGNNKLYERFKHYLEKQKRYFLNHRTRKARH